MRNRAERDDREAFGGRDSPEQRSGQQPERKRSQQHEHTAIEDPDRIGALEPMKRQLEGAAARIVERQLGIARQEARVVAVVHAGLRKHLRAELTVVELQGVVVVAEQRRRGGSARDALEPHHAQRRSDAERETSRRCDGDRRASHAHAPCGFRRSTRYGPTR